MANRNNQRVAKSVLPPNYFIPKESRVLQPVALAPEESTSDSEFTPRDGEKQVHPAFAHALRFQKFSQALPTMTKALIKQKLEKEKRLGKKSRMMYGLNVNIIPDRMRVTLRCAFAVARASAAGPSYVELVPSNLVDPMAAVGAVQPTGFDQWMTFYNQFLVMKSKTKVEVSSTSALAIAIAYGNQTFASSGFWSRYASHPRGWSKLFLGNNSDRAPLESGWVDHAEVVGLSQDEFRATSDYYGLITTAPTNNIVMMFYAQAAGADGSATAFAVDYTVTMDFEVEFFDRLDLVVS
jgi:hypothetical protein